MRKKATSYDSANESILDDLRNFIQDSPTPWHAVAYLKKKLLTHDFEELDSKEKWRLKPGGRYFTIAHGSTMAAFVLPTETPLSACIVGTHTDSPALKLKPNPEYSQDNLVMFGVEVYGSPLLNSWLNRDLGVAGRIYHADTSGTVHETLVKIADAPLTIPQLAIHLDREIHEKGLLLNKENHLAAIAAIKSGTSAQSYFEQLLHRHVAFDQLLSHDLFLYPLTSTHFVGDGRQMLAGYRLDNLCSVHSALKAIIDSEERKNELKAALFWDHEETGSQSANGAESPFLPHLLERILLGLNLSRENYLQLLNHSYCVSVDLAHAVHPNYPEKHEKNHRPLLNEGLTLKFNAQQRYATTAEMAASLSALCHQLKLPLQKFVMRNDMPCGSTIGPITATLMGIPTVDIGIPQLSMHSCRELIGCQDHLDMCCLLTAL